MRTITAAVFAAIITALSVAPASAHQPYGGCDEAWQAPTSDGAKHCRSHGWTVRSRVVIGPSGWVHVNRLPACKYEDSVGCYWNAATMGNGDGRSFVTLGTWEKHRRVFVITRSL